MLLIRFAEDEPGKADKFRTLGDFVALNYRTGPQPIMEGLTNLLWELSGEDELPTLIGDSKLGVEFVEVDRKTGKVFTEDHLTELLQRYLPTTTVL